MPDYKLPRSWREAQAALREQPAEKIVTPKDGTVIFLRQRDNGAVAVVVHEPSAEPLDLATFYPDRRIKLTTKGRNTFANLSRLNACLPRPYRVRKRGCHLRLIDLRRPKRAVATFLASTIFTPAPEPEAATIGSAA